MTLARRRPALSRAMLIRMAVVLPVGCFLAWLTFAVGAASVLGAARPEIAARFAPFDARTMAKLAEKSSIDMARHPRTARQARELSIEALRRDPTVVSAWRTLGLVASMEGRQEQASRLMAHAERLSRRDLPTQLFLIEERVQRDDIAGALHHYDIALRTSRSSADLLMPVLITASAQSDIAARLAPLLRSDPPWRHLFLWRLYEEAQSGSNVVRFVQLLGPDWAFREPDLLPRLTARLLGEREFAGLWQIYRMAGRVQAAEPLLVRNGGFDQPNPTPPLDWSFTDQDVQGQQSRIPNRGNDPSLLVRVSASGEGIAASQLLLLKPGRYRLSAVAGGVEGYPEAALRWQITCADPGQTGLHRFDIPVSPQGARSHETSFQIPETCPAQWLHVVAGASPGAEAAAWIDTLQIARQ